MSADDPGQREVAYRLFAAEYDDADYSYSESDEERAPNYVVTPTGARVNRLFVVGVLTEVEPVNENMLRGRVVDPTGAFVLYAGQYEPDEQATLERTDPPAFVAVTGKANTFQPDDGDQVYTSLRPESINTVDAETRDRWTVQAAEQTLERVGHAATALSTGLAGEALREALEDRGVDPALADGIPRALAHYDTTPAYLDAVRTLALDAARVVAGERDEVRELAVAPDDPGDVTAAELLAATPDVDTGAEQAGVAASTSDTAGHRSGTGKDTTGSEPEASGTTGSTAGEATLDGEASSAGAGTPPESGTSSESETASEPGTSPESGVGLADTAEETGVDTAEETGVESSDDTGVDTAEETGVDTADSTDTADGEDPGEFDPGEFDLPDEVRQEVEEEFGTDFQSGTEVDEPGEADIPTPETETAPVSDLESEPTETTEPGAGSETGGDDVGGAATDTDESTGAATAGDTDDEDTAGAGASGAAAAGDTDEGTETVEDPQAAVLGVMEELDDGSGADRDAVEREVQERHGLTAAEIEDAIQGALMDGKCYEPDERSLKPI
jgi:RPA family protein